jgi:phosphatidylserine decarboxylase
MSNPVFPVPNPANPRVKHRLGGWLPSDPQHWRSWIKTVAEHVRKHPKKPEDLHPSIKQLWALIETNTEVRMFFSMMLEQVPIQPPYNTNPAGGPEFRSWQELLLAFDFQLTSGPIWLYNTEGQQGLIGFPFNALLVSLTFAINCMVI